LELPNREQALVQSAKLTTYLLSISHSIGQKCATLPSFFNSEKLAKVNRKRKGRELDFSPFSLSYPIAPVLVRMRMIMSMTMVVMAVMMTRMIMPMMIMPMMIMAVVIMTVVIMTMSRFRLHLRQRSIHR
jgi:hypothetical protein